MMNMIKKKLHFLFSSKKFRSLTCLFTFVFLGGCDQLVNPDGTASNFNSQANCWQTKITHAVTEVVDKLYNDGVAQATSGGANVILVGFAIWMAFKLLKVLASFKEESVGEVWNEIFQKLFVCAFCAYFLGAGGGVGEAMNLFVIPLYNEVLTLGINMTSVTKETLGSIELGSFGTINFAHGFKGCPEGATVSAGALQGAVQGLSDCMICGINARLNGGLKIGLGLISTLSPGPVVVGLVIIPLFSFAKFAFVLYVVDSLFRVNFAAFLLPILIAGVPFRYTRKWSKHALLMFLNSAGCMLFIGLMIGLAVGALENIFADYAGKGELEPEKVEGIAGSMLLGMVLISLLMFNIPGQGIVLSDKFIGGGTSLVFAKKVSKFIQNSIKIAAEIIVLIITEGASEGATETMNETEATMQLLQEMKQKTQNVNKAINSMAGRNDDDE